MPRSCYLCGGHDLAPVHEFTRRPDREVDFGVPPEKYRRWIHRCRDCSVYLETHDMLPSDFYRGAYNDLTYSGQLAGQFERILLLPEGRSDNRERVRRVAERIGRWNRPPADVRVLDVGSGLCVFLALMKKRGFWCACLDPDPRAASHARALAGVDLAHAGTLSDFPAGQSFDVISFNKVLEHVTDPVAQLRLARPRLADGGFVYLELPDGEAALANGAIEEREEFYFGHYTNYDERSFRFLAEAAGFAVREMARIHEPSDKYTIWGILQPGH